MTDVPLSARRANTQDRLIDAAIASFAEKGVAASSVEEICDRAGFTRGAFYSNFSSKDELCVAVLQRKGEEIVDAATRAVDAMPGEPIAPATVEDVIHTAVEVFQASHLTDSGWLIARMELRLYALRNPLIREALTSAERQLDALLTQAIDAAAARVGARFALTTDLILLLLNAHHEALATQALMAGHEQVDSEWIDQMTALLRALVILPA